MSTSSTSINDLADDSLAHIFSFLPPEERVRLERVCRKWRQVAKTLAWTDFRKLDGIGNELAQRGSHKAVAKCRALIARAGPHLRELSITTFGDNIVHQWPLLRNLRHLHFGSFVSHGTLRAVADNLPRLQSIHFDDILKDKESMAGLHDLLRVDNASLQALRLPMTYYLDYMDTVHLPTLPSSLRLLHINSRLFVMRRRNCFDELLELAASCCPQLAMLMLPMDIAVSQQSLATLIRFKMLFYLRLDFRLAHTDLFGNTLASIGANLRALLLKTVDSKILRLIAKHCPLLEHCSFGIVYCPSEEGLFSALQALFQLVHLRSVSIHYAHYDEFICTQVMAAINGLAVKGDLEYLRLSQGLPLPVELITKLFHPNPKLRKLTCKIEYHTHAQLGKLKELLQNMDGPLDLELLEHCPLGMETEENGTIRIREGNFPDKISQPMLRQFWARAMNSVPELGNLDG